MGTEIFLSLEILSIVFTMNGLIENSVTLATWHLSPYRPGLCFLVSLWALLELDSLGWLFIFSSKTRFWNILSGLHSESWIKEEWSHVTLTVCQGQCSVLLQGHLVSPYNKPMKQLCFHFADVETEAWEVKMIYPGDGQLAQRFRCQLRYPHPELESGSSVSQPASCCVYPGTQQLMAWGLGTWPPYGRLS